MITSIITYQFKGLLIFKVLGIIQSKRLFTYILSIILFISTFLFNSFLTQADQMLNNFYNSIIQMLNNII